jgi:hypothetical protein
MSGNIDDNYAAWYTARLWQMLPAVYRQLDAPPGTTGPLQELLARIGAQAAVLRRSIDRLWDNQSIETCDDWVIPYLGDLLATRLVPFLDTRAQRLDVARTIYYRRRSGTLGLIDELASDVVAGRAVAFVEFFRRLGRTRHNFDPPISLVPHLPAGPTPVALLTTGVPAAVGAGLSGLYSRTPAGGFADLRNGHGAAVAGSAFDEYAYTADIRLGAQSTGWHNIPNLGVFIWWLQSYRVTDVTPLLGSAGQYSFDPTGRPIPLWGLSQPAGEAAADTWTAPNEWQLPIPVSRSLWRQVPDALYGTAFSIATPDTAPGSSNSTMEPADDFAIDPEAGTFQPTAAGGSFVVSYCFAFSAPIGAGGFPLPAGTTIPAQQAGSAVEVSGSTPTLDAVLTGIEGSATITIGDSLTRPGPTVDPGNGVSTLGDLSVVANETCRPLLRWSTAGGNSWTLTGHGGNLLLQGLWLQGADLVLAGTWAQVTLVLCTVDPGTTDPTAANGLMAAVDGSSLVPGHLLIQGIIGALSLQSCITGPIAVRTGGSLASFAASDCIIQSLTGAADPALNLLSGSANLLRTTVMGPVQLHALSASDCILDDVVSVVNTQTGCVRFSTIAAGSTLHAPYRCATVVAGANIFRSRAFGNPDYARLRADADQAITQPSSAVPAPSVLNGGENGAEPGAFTAETQALTLKGLAQKLLEYAPVGLTPVWVSVDS